MNDTLWVIIPGMFAVTFLVRASFLVFAQRLRFPPALVAALGHVPVAVLTAIIVPEAIAPGGRLNLSFTNPYLVGTLVAGLVAWKSNHTLAAVLIGFSAFGVLHAMA